jgi:hypothetical protein
MATKRKMRKFAEGDYVSTEGANPNIDDDVRARALKYVEGASEGSRDLGEPVTVTKTKTSVTAAPKVTSKASGPTPETKEEYTTRMEGLTKKQGLERVEPENYVPGPGLLKGMLKSVASKGMKTIGREALAAPSTIKMLEDKATKMLPYDKAGSLAAKRAARAEARDTEMKLGNAKNYGIDPSKPGSASALDALRKDIGGGKFTMKKGGKVKSYKSGGSVRSSASKRADGCAIRGKTRA